MSGLPDKYRRFGTCDLSLKGRLSLRSEIAGLSESAWSAGGGPDKLAGFANLTASNDRRHVAAPSGAQRRPAACRRSLGVHLVSGHLFISGHKVNSRRFADEHLTNRVRYPWSAAGKVTTSAGEVTTARRPRGVRAASAHQIALK